MKILGIPALYWLGILSVIADQVLATNGHPFWGGMCGGLGVACAFWAGRGDAA